MGLSTSCFAFNNSVSIETGLPSFHDGKGQTKPHATKPGRKRGRRNPCCCCLLWFIVIGIIIGVLVGLAVLSFWLVVHPKGPRFDVQTMHISGVTRTTTSGTIDYGIMAYNPNSKMSFYYSDISIKVEESGSTIGQGNVAGFSQGHKNTTYLNGKIDNVTITQSTLSSIEKNVRDVPLYAEVNLKVKIKLGAIKTWNFKIKVECNVYVDLTATRSQLKSSSCKVHW